MTEIGKKYDWALFEKVFLDAWIGGFDDWYEENITDRLHQGRVCRRLRECRRAGEVEKPAKKTCSVTRTQYLFLRPSIN